MRWSVVIDGIASPQEHMDRDKKLLDQIATLDGPLLRFYEWDAPSATYGYFIKPEEHLVKSAIDKYGLKLGRRPTGGGIIFHLKDLAFSIFIPAQDKGYSTNTLQNYAYVNGFVRDAILKLNHKLNLSLLSSVNPEDASVSKYFCMAKPTIYDIMVEGKKIGGAAERRTKEGLLHQGSISISLPDINFLKEILKNNDHLLEEIKNHTFSFTENEGDIPQIKNALKDYLISGFTQDF